MRLGINLTSKVAFAGYMGTGKTTAAKFLEQEYGYRILGFATPLYELGEIHCYPSYEWPTRLDEWIQHYLIDVGCYSNSFANKFKLGVLGEYVDVERIRGKNRTLLQRIGTEVGRGLDPDLWTNLFRSSVQDAGPDARLVNDNLRFENELEVCKSLGFITIFLTAESVVIEERYEAEYGRPKSSEQGSHASEVEIDRIRDKCDAEIYNGYSLESFYGLLEWTLHEMEVKA